MTTARRHILLAWLILAAGAFASPACAGALTDWFAVDDAVARDWRHLTTDDGKSVTLFRADAGDAPSKRIFVLYTKRSSAYDTAISRVLRVLAQKDVDASVTAAIFDGDAAGGERLIAETVAQRYDLIYSMGSAATAFMHDRFMGGPIPVVTICSKDPVLLGQLDDYDSGSGRNFAYTSLNVPVEVQLAYLNRLRPDLKNLVLLYAEQNVSAVETQVRPMATLAAAAGITVRELGVAERGNAGAELALRIPAMLTSLRENDPELDDSIFWVTGSTSVFREIATINAHAGPVPVLSVVPEVVAEGDESAVISIGVSFESNAHLAALYGIAVLDGAEPGAMPVGLVSPPDIAINFRRARHIGLRVPFSFLEGASTIYAPDGRVVRENGKNLARKLPSDG